MRSNEGLLWALGLNWVLCRGFWRAIIILVQIWEMISAVRSRSQAPGQTAEPTLDVLGLGLSGGGVQAKSKCRRESKNSKVLYD